MSSGMQRKIPFGRPHGRRAWLHALLILAFLAVAAPGGHAMAGLESPAHATTMTDCERCGGTGDAASPCTASLSQLPAAPIALSAPAVTTGTGAPPPGRSPLYRSPDLDPPRQPPRAV